MSDAGYFKILAIVSSRGGAPIRVGQGAAGDVQLRQSGQAVVVEGHLVSELARALSAAAAQASWAALYGPARTDGAEGGGRP